MDDRALKVLEYDKIISMLADYSLSPLGKAMAKELRPSSNKDEIENMLVQTNEAEMIIAQSEKAVMDTFPDVSNHINRADIGAILSPKELLDIAKLLKTANRVKTVISEFEGEAQVIPSIASSLKPNKWLYSEIYRCIEDEDTISDNASSELANIRKRINRAHVSIRNKLDSMIQSPQYQRHLQEPIVTIRNDRYVIPVKQTSRSSVPIDPRSVFKWGYFVHEPWQ